LGFFQAIDLRLKELINNIKNRLADHLRDRHLSSIVREGIDESLAKEAFEQRFEEIRLREMRKSLPGLLPENERPPFRDPQWDNRDDPVSGWVTLVHLFFYDLDNCQCPLPGAVHTRFIVFSRLCPGHSAISKSDRFKTCFAGWIFLGGAGNSRRCSRLVDLFIGFR